MFHAITKNFWMRFEELMGNDTGNVYASSIIRPMLGFLGEKLYASQTGKITLGEFGEQLKQRAVDDARVLRHLKKPETRITLARLCVEAGNDPHRAVALAAFLVEMTERPIREELTSVTARLLADRAMSLASKGENEQKRKGRLFWFADKFHG